MKQILRFVLILFCGLFFAENLRAAPRMAETLGSSYFLAAASLTKWHAGAYYRAHELDVRFDNMERELKLDKTMAFVGYDVLPWMTAYGVIGIVSPEMDNMDNANGFEFGGGILANLLDHDIIDNLSIESRVRVQGQLQLTVAHPEVENEDFDYSELYGALTLSVLNELVGNKRYWPESISLFAGPCFTRIDGGEFSQQPDALGLIVGSDVLASRRLALSASYEFYEDGSHAITGTLSLRF